MSLRVINGGTEPLAHWSAYPPRLSVIADMPAPPPMPGTDSCTGSKIHAYSITSLASDSRLSEDLTPSALGRGPSFRQRIRLSRILGFGNGATHNSKATFYLVNLR